MKTKELFTRAEEATQTLEDFHQHLSDYHDLVWSLCSSGDCYVLSKEMTMILNPTASEIYSIQASVEKIERFTGITFDKESTLL